jgi:hypothetical protein
MELETRVPLKMPKGAAHTMYVGQGFHVDVDHAFGRPVLEFVMEPIDDHAGSLSDAEQLFRGVYGRMAKAALVCAAQPTDTRLADVLVPLGLKPATVAHGNLRIDAYTVEDRERDPRDANRHTRFGAAAADLTRSKLDGPVHYTAGFALHVVPRLIVERLNTVGTVPGVRERAQEAVALAEGLTADMDAFGEVTSGHVSRAVVNGYIALLFMQVAALADAEGAATLVKNHTYALCRVPYETIFWDLPAAERTWLREHKPAIDAEVTRRCGVGSPKARLMLAAGLSDSMSGKRTDPEDLFGGMTVVAKGDPVGPPGAKRTGYALELRALPTGLGDLDKVAAQAVELLAYIRAIHDTDASTRSRPRSSSTPTTRTS